MYILISGNCTDDVYSYICKCEAGWTGKKCEIDKDECESSPCVNGNWSFFTYISSLSLSVIRLICQHFAEYDFSWCVWS